MGWPEPGSLGSTQAAPATPLRRRQEGGTEERGAAWEWLVPSGRTQRPLGGSGAPPVPHPVPRWKAGVPAGRRCTRLAPSGRAASCCLYQQRAGASLQFREKPTALESRGSHRRARARRTWHPGLLAPWAAEPRLVCEGDPPVTSCSETLGRCFPTEVIH